MLTWINSTRTNKDVPYPSPLSIPSRMSRRDSGVRHGAVCFGSRLPLIPYRRSDHNAET